MTTVTPTDSAAEPAPSRPADEPVVVKRRTIDVVLIAIGAVATVAFATAGALLLWGSNFAKDYVDKELSSQNISFPPAAALEEEGRTDLVKWADETVNTGPEAEAYASFINGHLEGIADGQTYADLGTPEREANAAVEEAKADPTTDEAALAELEAKAAEISGQRNTLFKGETLRGLLLTAYAWAKVGVIAGYAALAAFLAAAVMLILVLLGVLHHRKAVKS